MKTRPLFLLFIVLLLSACSPFTIVSSSGEQPTPVEETIPANPDLKPIAIDHVEVQVGVGSPIPVNIVASGTWPDLCSQIAEVQNKIQDFQIEVTVLASTVVPCRPDNLGLSFRFELPLNTGEMARGTYTITVNGISTALDVPVQP